MWVFTLSPTRFFRNRVYRRSHLWPNGGSTYVEHDQKPILSDNKHTAPTQTIFSFACAPYTVAQRSKIPVTRKCDLKTTETLTHTPPHILHIPHYTPHHIPGTTCNHTTSPTTIPLTKQAAIALRPCRMHRILPSTGQDSQAITRVLAYFVE